VTYRLTRDGGTSYSSGASLEVSSDGAVQHTAWQNGFDVATPRVSTSQISPETVSALAASLSDPNLQDPALAGGQGPVELTVTVDGKTQKFLSPTDSFPGAAGRLLDALAQAAPLPALRKNHP